MTIPINAQVKKELDAGGPTQCTVVMDGVTTTSDDFVVILSGEDGSCNLKFSTDALTLGMGMQMISRAFVEAMNELPEDQQKEIQAILVGQPEILEEAPNAEN